MTSLVSIMQEVPGECLFWRDAGWAENLRDEVGIRNQNNMQYNQKVERP